MEPEPFSLSSERCLWQMCSQRADLRIFNAGAQFCREHSLFVWSIIDREIRESRMTIPEIKAREQLKLAKRRKAQETAEERRTRPGYVYYLRVGAHYKIGFASNLELRLASYPPDTELLAVEEGSLKLEHQRHREFAHSRAAGREWYRPNPALADHIRDVAENGYHTRWADSEWRRNTERVKVTPHSWR